MGLGLLVLPGITVGFGLLARRYGRGDIRFTGEAGMAPRGQAGCEATVLSNWILGRDDQIGCPAFNPVDAAEERLGRPRVEGTATTVQRTQPD